MGSTESTLPTMEEQSAEQQIQQQQQVQQHSNVPDQRRASEQLSDEQALTTSANTDETATAAAAAAAAAAAPVEDPWWWEIENENLILDLTPNVANVANVDASHESENAVTLSDDFNTLLKIGENVNLTLTINSETNNNNNNINDNNNDNNNDSNNNSNNDCAVSISVDESAENSAHVSNESAVAQNTANESNNSTDVNQSVDPITDVVRCATKKDETAIVPTPETSTRGEQSLEEFKEELRIKRLARQSAVQDLRDEISTLRQQLAAEQALTRRLRCGANEGAGDAAATENVALDKDEVIAVAVGFASTEPDADDEDPMSRGRHAIIELANAQLALQLANAENLSLRTELGVVQKQVGTLKEVIACCKQMLNVKEEQCVQLKTKLQEIETSFGERELRIMSNNLRQEYERQLGNIRQLRQLYEERQRIAAAEQENLQRLISIKRDELSAEQEKTKSFEERQQTLLKEIESVNNELAALRDECNEHKFEKRALKEEMGAVNTLFSQMVMGFNGRDNLDIDRLTMMLEENRTLLNDMATKEVNCSDGATLPKLLFELVEQAAVSGKAGSCSSCSSSSSRSHSPTPTPMQIQTPTCLKYTGENEDALVDEQQSSEEANTVAVSVDVTDAMANDAYGSGNGSGSGSGSHSDTKACQDAAAGGGRKQHRKSASNRMKLPGARAAVAAAAAATTASSSALKCHESELMAKVATTQEIIGNLPKVWKVLMELLSHHKIERVPFEENGASEECYKSVETPSGMKTELSVSKTYIKLKDLILEKKSLVKETNRLKTLNSHLDYRLNEQEKRLSAVSLELTKTWHLVGKMQRQHRQLHTQEQILRYQLQQKRRLLTELKEELEYCRRKWAAARAKNDESQEQCNDLRREFAKRKLEQANNSAESGYSDSGQASDEELGLAAHVGAVELETNVGAVGGCDVTAAASGGGGGSGAATVPTAMASSSAVCRRKRLKEMFEHTRKIKRMQSTSPGRAGDGASEIVLRWNSAPPTCGWRVGCDDYVNGDDDEDAVATQAAAGAIPKNGATRGRLRNRRGAELDGEVDTSDADDTRTERAERIQRLEEQCKSLIQQVLETSDNRERLEVQLRSFQDEIAPVQYALPLNDLMNRKRLERMTRASSAPAAGTLTPREEEYTRKRSERLERLEEESRQLMSRIKRTSDRGHYLRCSLDRLRRAPSREGSFESNTEEEQSKTEETVKPTTSERSTEVNTEENKTANLEEASAITREATTSETSTIQDDASLLTPAEEAYTSRRAARLQRLEAESRQLLTRLTRNNERGNTLGTKLDVLHEHFGSADAAGEGSNTTTADNTTETTDPTEANEPTSPTIEQRIGNIEKISSNRMERLRILEEEGQELLSRLSNSSARGSEMIKRIEAREQTRELRLNEEHEAAAEEATATDTLDVVDVDTTAQTAPTSGIETPAVAPLMPTLNNVACTSIVGEELNERVTVTTTPSQIAAQQGAIPKQQVKTASPLLPTTQLNAAKRAEAARNVHATVKEASTSSSTNTPTNKVGESLEDMVRRLRELPFPGTTEEQQTEEKLGLIEASAVTDLDTNERVAIDEKVMVEPHAVVEGLQEEPEAVAQQQTTETQ